MIAQMSDHLNRVNPDFDSKEFTRLACDKLDQLELKQRSEQITQALKATLDSDFKTACATLLKALHPVDDAELSEMNMDAQGIRGWPIMPMGDFVAQSGLDDVETSLDTLAELTKRFSAEFAIRPFFIHAEKQTLEQAHQWAEHPNVHIRRLASEGSRPKLPWGLRLQSFVDDPAPLLPLLEKLRDDSEEYVRRSVANNINDIAKDHPDLVAQIATDWLSGANRNRERLVKHACRSLIKDGHQPTLKALGYGPASIELPRFTLTPDKISLGESVSFEIEIKSTSKKVQPLIVDFLVHHQKANGSLSAKTFKWKNLDLGAGKSVTLKKTHPMKPVTTRTYYAGLHRLEIQINGISYGMKDFDLEIPTA